MKMEQTECSETSAYKFQMPGNHPKESIQQDSVNLCVLQGFVLIITEVIKPWKYLGTTSYTINIYIFLKFYAN